MNTKKIVSIRFLGKITFRVCIVLLLEYFAKARAKTKKYNSKKKGFRFMRQYIYWMIFL